MKNIPNFCFFVHFLCSPDYCAFQYNAGNLYFPDISLAMPKKPHFQRAADAPPLPTGTAKFILYCLASFRGWFVLMVLMETGQAEGSILVPYAIKAIMDGVAQGSGATMLESLRGPLLLLAGLNVAEILFSRASGAILIIVGPRLRQRTTKALYAYL